MQGTRNFSCCTAKRKRAARSKKEVASTEDTGVFRVRVAIASISTRSTKREGQIEGQKKGCNVVLKVKETVERAARSASSRFQKRGTRRLAAGEKGVHTGERKRVDASK